MQPQGWKNFLFAIFFTTNGVVQVGTKLDTAWADNTHVESPTVGELPQQVALGERPKQAERRCQQQQEVTNVLESDLDLRKLAPTNRTYSSVKLEPNISPPEQIDIAGFSQGASCFEQEEIESEKFSQSNQSLQLATASNCQNDICQQSIGWKSLLSQRLSDGTPAPPSPDQNHPQPNNPQPNNPQPNNPQPNNPQPNNPQFT
ncbi:hypothetical protein NIES22_31450 [Calothrix brevissima NIES-22]|nr:hypothetical protein NIES22_31450 [Calothrix brevissima NIES-22]